MDIVGRVKGIIVSPNTEWPVIASERGDVASLMTGYVLILAAIPAVCSFIGTSLIGFGPIRIPVAAGLIHAIVQYVISIVMVFVMGFIVDALAPSFNGQKNFLMALRLAAYSYTPVWLCGIFLLIPALGILGILGLYGIYLFFVGLPVMMKSPADKSLLYTLAVVVIVIVISIVIGFIEVALVGGAALMALK